MKYAFKILSSHNLKKFILFATFALSVTLAQADPILVATLGGFSTPYGVVSDPGTTPAVPQSGRIYVSEQSNPGKISSFNNTGQSLSASPFATGLNLPTGVTIGTDPYFLWVASSFSNNINIFNSSGTSTTTLAQYQVPGLLGVLTNLPFTQPNGVAIDPNLNKAYILNKGSNLNPLFFPTSDFVLSLDLTNLPANPGANTTLSGTFLIQGLNGARSIAAQPSTGNIFIANTASNNLRVFSSAGVESNTSPYAQFATAFNQPLAVAVVDSATSPIWVTDLNPNGIVGQDRLQVRRADGTTFSYVGLTTPTSISINQTTGQVYVVEQGLSQVKIFFDPLAWVSEGTSTLQTLSLNQPLTLNPNYNLTVTPIAGSDGILTLAAGGVLSLRGGALSPSKLAFTGGEIDAYTNTTISTVNPINVDANGATLYVDADKTLTITDQIIQASAPATALVKKGAGELDLLLLSNGNVTIEQGIIGVSSWIPGFINQGAILTLGTSTGNNDTSGTLKVSNTAIAVQHDVVLGTGGGIFDVAANASLSLGTISGAGSLTKKGASILALGGPQNPVTYTGGTFLNEGVIQIDMTNSLPTTGDLTIGSVGTLNLNLYNQAIRNLTGSGIIMPSFGNNLPGPAFLSMLTLNPNQDNVFSGTIQDGGSGKIAVTINGGNTTQTLSGNNSFSGGLTLTAGTLKIAPTNPIYSGLGIGSVTLQNATALQFGLGGLVLGNNIILDSGSAGNPGQATIDTGGFASILSGTITQAVNTVTKLIIQGGNIFTLNGVASPTGGIEVLDNTTLRAGIPNAISGALNLSGQNAIFGMGAAQGDQTLTTLSGSNTSQVRLGSQFLTLTQPSSFDGTFLGTGAIDAQADLTLGGQNANTSFTGFLIVDALSNPVTVTMNVGSSLATGSTLYFQSTSANKATLDMSAASQTISDLLTDGTNNSLLLGNQTLTFGTANDSNFSGVISGVGGKIVKQGAGTWTVSGQNTFDGGLSVQGGKVIVGSSQSLGQGDVFLSNGTTLSFGQSMTVTNPITLLGANTLATLQTNSPTTINNIIGGDGGLVKSGSSSLTLMQANTYQGPTTITAGTLVVDGSIGKVTVGGGATLTGLGSVGSVINNGTVTPSDPEGVFTINGDYTSPGTTLVDVNPNTSSHVTVTGIANINKSTLSVDVVPGELNAYEGHGPFEVLSSNNPVNGQFGAVQSSHVRYKWMADYATDPNKVFLNFDGHVSFEEIVRSVSDNPNAISTAHYLDTLTPTPGSDLSNVITLFNSQPEAHGITNIAEEISPDELLLTEETATLVNENNGLRMHYLRDMMASSKGSAGFTTNKTPKTTALLSHLRQAFGQVRGDDPFVRMPTMSLNKQQQMQENGFMTGSKGGIWIQGFGNISRQKANRIDMGYHNKMAGTLIGIDYKLRSDLFIGASFGYDQSRIKWVDALSKGKIKDYLTSVYSTWFYDRFYINASLTGSYNRYHIRRRMTFYTLLDRTARSRHDGYVVAPSLEIGQGFMVMNGLEIAPFLREDYVHIHEKGYTEKDAGALNLHIRSKTHTALRSEPGFNFYKHYQFEEGLLTAKVKLSYVNKHPLKHGKVTANLVGQPGTFLASGTNKTQHQVSPGLGIDYKAASGFFISAAYDAQVGSKYQSHELSLKIGTKF